jgi:hypothetical protein
MVQFIAMMFFNVMEAFGAWLAPHLLAALMPPAIWIVSRNRWQLSMRTILAAVTLLALIAAMAAQRIRTIADSPFPFVLARDYLTDVALSNFVVFGVSLVVTGTMSRFFRPTELRRERQTT